jgi:hypothetical protein
MSYPNPNPNPKPNPNLNPNPNPKPNHNPNPSPTKPTLGHNFIAPDTISYRNFYKILSEGHFNIGHYYVLQLSLLSLFS